ncbi:MAG: domain containing protein [Candidatus Eremiobacteraeota bacterium]|nr:domain containing protein [Candidatus Eremiobacteraeota bacterium]
MNVFARIENACARVVEDAFARVFPSALDPAQIARRLVSTAQAAPSDLYLVRVHPVDYARLAPDRDFLEGRWSAMLREALPRERADAARVVLDEDPDVVSGSLAIEAVVDERAQALALERPDGTRVELVDGLTLGRSDENIVKLRDARASRKHARIVADGTGWTVEDLGSSNGTFVDGAQVRRSRLDRGQTLTIGDTPLKVVDAT